jgi:hypothetical protein
LVNAHEVHHYHAARADIGVPDLRIAHLTLWQAYIAAKGGKRGMGTCRPDPVKIRGVGQPWCVVGVGRAYAPAIEDAKNDRLGLERVGQGHGSPVSSVLRVTGKARKAAMSPGGMGGLSRLAGKRCGRSRHRNSFRKGKEEVLFS